MENLLEKEDVIRKVQKLLSLGKDKGAFEAESATALQLAAKLLEEHGLEMKDVEFDEAGQLKADGLVKEHVDKKYMLWPWEKDLTFVVQLLLPVRLVWLQCYGGYRKFIWCGTKEDVKLAHMMWETLRAELKRLSKDELTPLAKRSFCTGAVESLQYSAVMLKRKREASAEVSKALVVSKQNQVTQWMKSAFDNLSAADNDRGSRVDAAAHQRGFIAGSKVKLTNNKELGHGQ